MTPALLSQEQMELLEKEYRFKNWREEDLSVLENLILSCSGRYKLWFIKDYLKVLQSPFLKVLSSPFSADSRIVHVLELEQDDEIAQKKQQEQKQKEEKYKQMLTHIVEILASDKTGAGNEKKSYIPQVLSEIMNSLKCFSFEDWFILVDGEKLTYSDFGNAISFYARFDDPFNYQSQREFVELIKLSKPRNIVKTLLDQEKQQYFIDCFISGLLSKQGGLKEVNSSMSLLQSEKKLEYQNAMNELKKEFKKMINYPSLQSIGDPRKINSLNFLSYRFLISYVLSNGQEDAWFNDYAPLLFKTKEDLIFLNDYPYIFNDLGWADKLAVMLSDNLKQNWAGALILQLNSLESVTRREKYLPFKDGLSEDDDEEVQYSLINITESDKAKLLSLIDTSVPVEELKKVLNTIRQDDGYINFVNALTFPQGEEYKRLILEGKVKTPDELLQIIESLNFDDIEHISDNLFISLNRENIMDLAYEIGWALDYLKENLDKKDKETISEIDEEMILDDLRTLEEVCFVLSNKLISGFNQVRQKLELGWFKRWLMGGIYREQLNDLNNKLTGFAVTLPQKILEQVFINQNYNSRTK